MSAAGLGAFFYALFTAKFYITRGTFDHKMEPVYWTRILLGVIAGIILSEIIAIDLTEQGIYYSKLLLALLGGFSAHAVYKVLDLMVGNCNQFYERRLQSQAERAWRRLYSTG